MVLGVQSAEVSLEFLIPLIPVSMVTFQEVPYGFIFSLALWAKCTGHRAGSVWSSLPWEPVMKEFVCMGMVGWGKFP